MAKVYPFSAIHYDPKTVPLSDVVTPPYDVISPEEAQRFLASSPYNFAHLILPKAGEQYSDVRDRINAWKEKGVFKQENASHFYLYEQEFKWNDKTYTRSTLMAAVALAEFSDKKVLPHELTHDKPRKDRLEILRQTQCNLSSVFAMVKDKEGTLSKCFEETASRPPFLSAKTPDGILHRVWPIGKEWESSVQGLFENRPLYIVDGHHRYGSALAYAKEQNTLGTSKPSGRMFFAIANAYDPALLVLPTHRCVKDLVLSEAAWNKVKEDYEVSDFSPDKIDNYVETLPTRPEFVVRSGQRWVRCAPKNWERKIGEWGSSLARLSVAWTDKAFLPEVCDVNEESRGDRLSYYKETESLRSDKNAENLCLVLPPMPVTAICDVAEEGKFMPQKSTYFYPKLGAGLLIRPLTTP